MTLDEVMQTLEGYGDERTKNTLMKHGAQEPVFGVKVADLKKILKKTKKNHELSLALYNTGNSDAMYLAALMADEKQITKEQVEDWADKAYWYYLFEYAVPWVASETEFGFELGVQWIESDQERIAAAGWSTLASIAALYDDSTLDVDVYKTLLDRAQRDVHGAQNRVRFAMNSFIIAIGSYVKDLTPQSQKVAAAVGKVEVTLGGAGCKVPLATEYIQKVIDKDRVGKKRKTARC